MPQIWNIFGNNTKTKEGEVTVNINLTLTLKIEQDGTVRLMAADAPTQVQAAKTVNELPEKLIPDLSPGELIQFGKDV